LERRDVPSVVSVTDVTVREGPASLGPLSAGAAGLVPNGPRDIVFNNIPGHQNYRDLFVTSYVDHSVLRFDWETQTYSQFVTPGSGGLGESKGVAVGPDGNLYVTALGQNWVLQFDGNDGHFIKPYVDAGSGGLNSASGLTFGPDGNLYVCSSQSDQILKYQGLSVGPNGEQPGQFLDVFANTGTGSVPDELTFGPDGNLYVACPQYDTPTPYDGVINRYQGLSGQLIDVFVPTGRGGLSNARSPIFDSQGHLYVTDSELDEVLRYQGPTEPNPGTYIDAYITSGQGGLNVPLGLAIGPDGNLYVADRDYNKVARFAPASQALFVVTLDAASTNPVSVDYASANGTALAGTDFTLTAGTLVFAPGVTAQTINVPITTVATGGPTKTFTMNLSGESGATVNRRQATGSILNRMTKFFVVDSGTVKTYQYGSGGTSEEITVPQLSSDTAPRGAATTATGTRVWVADANKNVYVYDNHGVQLGSWTAGGLPGNAQLTGIATNGTDLWLVDSRSTKVYKYTGAASRLSGSQTAASSFSLVSGKNGDSNPQDIVTDGTSFWVVDGTALKVFKYTLSGSLLGSWTIDPANTHPTGLTINPANVSDIWIVDNGTLKVYQYTAAASRISGSQNASASFALNPYDTNPQGIADPPPPDMLLTPTPAPSAADRPITTDQAFVLLLGPSNAAPFVTDGGSQGPAGFLLAHDVSEVSPAEVGSPKTPTFALPSPASAGTMDRLFADLWGDTLAADAPWSPLA
jgi:streptogramin lyase